MRDAFSAALISAATHHPKVLLLTGDHGYALFDSFRKACPAQFLNAGVAEQNMVGVAAGLAKGGFRPIVYGLSAFVPVRVLEQIKMDICYEQLPVVLVGDGAGFVYSHLGASHQSTEDIAVTRVLPHLSIFSPADASEMTYCMEAALSLNAPAYLRMGKSDVGTIHSVPVSPNLGDLIKIATSASRVAVIATGSMVRVAADIALKLGGMGVWSAPTLKPINAVQVMSICQQHDVVFVMEEHSINGGLGSIVAEIASTSAPTRIIRLGVEDRFSARCGTYQYLLKEHGLDALALQAKMRAAL